ncbi:hypothetical protein M0R72_14310 [Candidatus Pacearchaeota archaeon]|jgi:hypothetical protein|nr:hypothetical protein [Candidatus Pacearchaeota archaeon]
MSSENTLTGREGKFAVDTSLVARTTQWSVNPKLASKSEWGDSDSGGYTNRAAGRKDATFNAEGKYDTTDEVFDLFQPEDIAIAVLWLNASSLYWDFPRALCDDFNMTVNIDSQEVIGWTSGWGADGIFYYPGQSGSTSRAVPA